MTAKSLTSPAVQTVGADQLSHGLSTLTSPAVQTVTTDQLSHGLSTEAGTVTGVTRHQMLMYQ